jgi:hypothetical protein
VNVSPGSGPLGLVSESSNGKPAKVEAGALKSAVGGSLIRMRTTDGSWSDA